MSSWNYDFAKLLKNNNSGEKIHTDVGTIVQENPIVISLLGGDILAQGAMLVQTSALKSQLLANLAAGVSNTGLKVAVIGLQDNQKFMALSLTGTTGIISGGGSVTALSNQELENMLV